jgi:hypothetical protein
MHINMHILHTLHTCKIVHIQHIVICILCILCIFTMKNVSIQFFIVYCSYCLVPHPRAQLFTYHHLQPSPLLNDSSQKLWESQMLSMMSCSAAISSTIMTTMRHAYDPCVVYVLSGEWRVEYRTM